MTCSNGLFARPAIVKRRRDFARAQFMETVDAFNAGAYLAFLKGNREELTKQFTENENELRAVEEKRLAGARERTLVYWQGIASNPDRNSNLYAV